MRRGLLPFSPAHLLPGILCLVVAAACGDGTPIRGENLWIGITTTADRVELGRAFPLEVVRICSKELEPEEWSEESLEPLRLRLVEETRREDDARVEEVRRYRAYAFTPGDLTLPAPVLRARPRSGGPEVSVRGRPLVLEVVPVLDPGEPGPPELPGGPLSGSSTWTVWPAIAAAALALLLLLLLHRLRRPAPAEAEGLGTAEAPAPGPRERALARIEKLRGWEPAGPEELTAYHVEASALTRDYLSGRFGLTTTPMSTEECLAAYRSSSSPAPAHPDLLARVLGACDLVKFARHASSPRERNGMLDEAERLVRETTPDDGPDDGGGS